MTMSEHAWVLENIETYNAGGLEHDERERLEKHTAECPACAGALAEAKAMDERMDALFAEVRPSPALEDRLVRSLRSKSLRNPTPWLWMGSAAAAVILFGVVGAGATHLIGELPFPGLAGAGSHSQEKALPQLATSRSSDNYIVSQSVEQLAREDSEK